LVTGLNSNKIGFVQRLLYTAETSAVAVMTLIRNIVKRIPVEGAQMLNDLATGFKGNYLCK
jgi:hypothetical protein